MIVRPLEAQDRLSSSLISTVAFHGRIDDIDKAREASLKQTGEDWGAFADSGELMAHIVNNHFTTRFDGAFISNGGIGGVSTLPEYRETGAVRAIFSQLLPAARERGEVVSSLYPFNHAFYRKFGYETVVYKNTYTFPVSALKGHRFEGEARLWKTGDRFEAYTDLYNRFASGFNLAMLRDEELTKRHVSGDYYRDRKFAYMLSRGGKSLAYVVFQDVRANPSAKLSVKDIAWDGREGFTAILGFLARFTADYGTIELPLPRGVELYSVIKSPMAYDIEKTSEQNYMLRVMNVERLLSLIKKPAGASFTVRVHDDILPENNGVWRVSDEGCSRSNDAPDMLTSVQALGQMAVGAADLNEARLRDDVEVVSNDGTLSAVFTRKPIYVADYF